VASTSSYSSPGSSVHTSRSQTPSGGSEKRSRDPSPHDESLGTTQKRPREGRTRRTGGLTTYKRSIGKSAPAEDSQFLTPDATVRTAHPKASQRKFRGFIADESESIVELGVRELDLGEDADVNIKGKSSKGKGKARVG
jgi:hypothetical protein